MRVDDDETVGVGDRVDASSIRLDQHMDNVLLSHVRVDPFLNVDPIK